MNETNGVEANDLDKALIDAVVSVIGDGAAKKALEKAVSDCVARAVHDLFSWSGDAKKALDERLGSIIVPAIERHDFGAYAVKLDAVLEEIANTSALGDTAKAIASFKGLVAGDGAEEATFHDIFAAYGKWVADEFDCTGRDITDGEYDSISVGVETAGRKSPWSTSDFESITAEFCLVDSDSDDEQAPKFARVVEFYRWNGDHPLPSNGGWYVRDTWKPTVSDLARLSEFDVLVMRMARRGSSVIGDIEDEHDCVAPLSEPELTYE